MALAVPWSPIPLESQPSPESRKVICAVEDDQDIARLIQHHLGSNGYAVEVFSSAAPALEAAMARPPSLFLLDIMLPDMSGLDLCRQIRQTEKLFQIPVVFLTARTAEPDRIQGLEAGGDDYILKPFSPRELVARVKAVLRASPAAAIPQVLKVGELEIDPGGMTLKVRGKMTFLTSQEFRLLHHMARQPGRVLTRYQLLKAVWNQGVYVSARSVDVYVWRLREKIEMVPDDPRYLKTVRGIGYRFDDPR